MANYNFGFALLNTTTGTFEWAFALYSTVAPQATVQLFRREYDPSVQAYRVVHRPTTFSAVYGVVQISQPPFPANLYTTVFNTARDHSPDERGLNPGRVSWGSAAWAIRLVLQLRQLVNFPLRLQDHDIYVHVTNQLIAQLQNMQWVRNQQVPCVKLSNGGF
ncbi:hypothetical protein NLJ89_g5275 [Agrocybe chaxingu]|uniref:Uncharacterized protein n=1 Tax=Agrocybe chaxingu TaxID=84603 RepID=A0A9W8JYV5_9AGAR|nr:hypothetical protein NLJ89_g5275 [Agrocybe chaxingu]